MSAAMFICVVFVKCLQWRVFSYYYTGLVIQHLIQTSYLFAAIWWGYHRQWYWVQAGFLVLHALSNLMKVRAPARQRLAGAETVQMHSYMAHNGMLATVFRRLGKERKQLSSLVGSHPGGAEAAYAEAAAHKAELEAQEAMGSARSTPVGTPGIITPGLEPPASAPIVAPTTIELELPKTNGHYVPPTPDANDLRRRVAATSTPKKRKSVPATEALPKISPSLPQGTSLEPSHMSSPHESKAPSPLSWHPDQQIATLARNIDAMEDELKSNGKLGLVWPQNVTYQHFLDYMSLPTLVYQLEYPRTNTSASFILPCVAESLQYATACRPGEDHCDLWHFFTHLPHH